jgi:uncharacterized protein YbaR (Trm112 family)
MAHACPGCKESGLVHDLPAFWRGLAPGAELKAELAPPPKPEVRWQWPTGLLGFGVLLLLTGALWGLLLLLAGVAAGYIAHGRYTAAQMARAAWEQTLYCRHCAVTFPRVVLEVG